MQPGKAVPSSRTRCALTSVCILRLILHNKQMPMRAAIVGCAGYAGQETLDRVLAHPELEAVAPLVGAIEPASVVVDAKSGVSGAGRGLKASSHAGFVLENLSAYRVGTHQHAPEIGQALGFPVCFVPHLLPVRRGLLATCYAQPTGDLRGLLEDAYADSELVRVLPDGVAPELGRVHHTDCAEIALFADPSTGQAIVLCAL